MFLQIWSSVYFSLLSSLGSEGEIAFLRELGLVLTVRLSGGSLCLLLLVLGAAWVIRNSGSKSVGVG